MEIVCLNTSELKELWNLISDNKEKIMDYAKQYGLDFGEVRALMSACEKVEEAYNKGVDNGDI